MRYVTQSSNRNVTALIGREQRTLLGAPVALAALLAWLGAGCSESSPTQKDGGASNDASSTSDGGVTDMTPIDASPTEDLPTDATPTIDADACECSVGDAGNLPIGVLSMPCYCVKQDWHNDFGQRPTCPTYDVAVECPDAARSFHIATYKNCNFVTINYDVGNGVDMRVYDATNHELVGAIRGNDSVVASCGARPATIIESGVVPGPECERAGWLRPCDKGDAGDN